MSNGKPEPGLKLCVCVCLLLIINLFYRGSLTTKNIAYKIDIICL